LKGNDVLPAVKNIAIASVTAFALAAATTAPAHALGKNEKNFIAGAATALIINGIVRNERARRYDEPRYVERRYVEPSYVAPRYVEPQYVEPRYIAPRPVYQASVYDSAAAVAFNSYSRSERLAIQRQLSRQGYYRSGIDGSFGPGTYNAIAAYARDIGASSRLASREGAYSIYDGLIF
jgi:hypothetical protein